MNLVEQYYFEELAKGMREYLASIVRETVTTTLALMQQTQGDAISQRQAEKEFGRTWLHAHIVTEGNELYTQAPMDLGTCAKNRKRTFSRAQLAAIKARETSDDNFAQFVCKFHRVMEGYDDFSTLPVGARELVLREKEIRLQDQLERLEQDKTNPCPPGRIRPPRAKKKGIKK